MISDITIIGGGVIGLMTAREFHLAGASVTLIEKKQIGQESSWAGGGILLPLYPWRQASAISELVMQSLRLYPDLAAQLLAETGLNPEWHPCGLLIVKNPDYQKAVDWCRHYNIPFQHADHTLLNPLQTQTDQALWLPTIAQARNPRLVKSLKQDLLNKGVNIFENTSITQIVLSGNRVARLEANSTSFAVNQLVLATGAWSQQLFKQWFPAMAHAAPQINPVKGQMLLFDGKGIDLSHMVLDEDRYLIPRLDGHILVGSTVEQADFNKSVTEQAKSRLYDFACNLMPPLKQAPLVKHWAGLRPGTAQGIPYITRHPDLTNVAINAGHFRNGLAMGPASAQLLVDLVLNRPTVVSPEPYTITSPH